MAGNLLDMARSYLDNPALLERLGGAVGLSPEKTQELMKAIVPTVMAGTVQTASSSEFDAKRLFDMLGQGHFDGSMLNDLGNRLQGGGLDEVAKSGKGILSTLFGGRLGAVEEMLARFSGAGKGPVSMLLGVAGPFVMHLLGRVKSEQGLSVGGLRELLLSQKDSIAESAPPGLASALGLGSLSDLGGMATAAREKIGAYASEARQRAPVARPAPERPAPATAPGSRWLTIGVVCLALLGFLWFMRARSSHLASESLTPTAARPAAPRITGTPVGNLVTINLPNGQTIQVEPGSAAMSVVDYFRKPSAGPGRIALTQVTFESGGSKPSADSTPALDRLAIVLKAYPNAGVLIQSYVPAGADEPARRLAADRAGQLKTYLTDHGVPPDRVQSATTDQPATQPAEAELVIRRTSR